MWFYREITMINLDTNLGIKWDNKIAIRVSKTTYKKEKIFLPTLGKNSHVAKQIILRVLNSTNNIIWMPGRGGGAV